MRPDGSASGIIQIPLDDEIELVPLPDDDDDEAAASFDIEVSLSDLAPPTPAPAASKPPPPAPPQPPAPTRTSTLELTLDDLAEIPELDAAELEPELPSPRRWSASARRALAETPLFSAFSAAALEAIVSRVDLVCLDAGEILFRQGEPGDTLYVVADGEVDVIHEGPPRNRVARLGPGAFFGEVALVTEQPRSATIAAATPTDLLAIDRTLVSELVADHPEVLVVILRFVRDRLLTRLMNTSPLFQPLPPDERAALAARFRFLEIDAGTVLVGEGARAPGLYIFLAGRGDVRRGDELVTYLGAGHVAGATSLLTRAPSEVQVTAITRCLALLLAAGDFREVIMTHPHVLEYVGALAAERGAALDPGAQLDLGVSRRRPGVTG